MSVRVLIVDDQEPFRMAARMVVDATDGFDVVGEAETGEDSVSMAADLQPDLVLMDVNLPGINGLDATRQILSGSDTVVVLLLSTYEEDEYAPQGRRVRGGVLHPQSGVRPGPARRRLGGRRARIVRSDHASARHARRPLTVTCRRPRAISTRRAIRRSHPAGRPSPAARSRRRACGSNPPVVAAPRTQSDRCAARAGLDPATPAAYFATFCSASRHAEVHGRLDLLRIAADAVGVERDRQRRFARLRLERGRSPLSASSGG